MQHLWAGCHLHMVLRDAWATCIWSCEMLGLPAYGPARCLGYLHMVLQDAWATCEWVGGSINVWCGTASATQRDPAWHNAVCLALCMNVWRF